jgi:hypothetical protein
MSRNIGRLDERTSTIHLTLQGKGALVRAWSRAFLPNTSAITAWKSTALTAIL